MLIATLSLIGISLGITLFVTRMMADMTEEE
jgi:hypothetical protein